jgi:hypothetical protein
LRVAPLRWLPAFSAAAYLATVVVEFPRLVHALYWDTDVAAPLVLAERLRGHGTVYISHYAEWSSLWWLLATRHLPGHVQLWEGTGYAFALLGAGLVGWATARVAGKWSGVTAAAAPLVVGPIALRSLLTVNFHVSTPFTAAVLGAYLVLLAKGRPRILVVVTGVLAGINAASDPLLWVAGIAPFAIAAAVLAAGTRRLDVAVRAAITLALSIVCAISTNVLMHSLGYEVASAPVRAAHLGSLPSNALQFLRMVALLGGANFAFQPGYPPEPLRAIVAILVGLAVAAAVGAGIRSIARRSDALVRAYACYWATATILLAVAFVGTTNATALGSGSFNYLLTLALTGGAGIALLARSGRMQLTVALAVAAVGATNIAGIAGGRAGTPKGAIGTYEPALVRALDAERLTHGYAGYWDAQNLTWQSGMRLFVAPVSSCTVPAGPGLCGSTYTTIRSWYEGRSGRSFLIVDPTNGFVPAPAVVAGATRSYRFGPLTVYVFSYDLARKIRPPQG